MAGCVGGPNPDFYAYVGRSQTPAPRPLRQSNSDTHLLRLPAGYHKSPARLNPDAQWLPPTLSQLPTAEADGLATVCMQIFLH
jgi:hypothetical protein